MKFIVRDGSSILLWHVVWHGDMPLISVFPVLHDLVIDKQTTIAQCMHRLNNTVYWFPTFAHLMIGILKLLKGSLKLFIQLIF